MRCLIAISSLLLVLAAGCGSDDSDTKTVTQTETVTGASTPTTTSTAEAPLRDSGIRPGADGLIQFQTPTKNIGCAFASDELRCDIIKHSWQAPPRPANCDLDYGDAIVLGGGVAAQFVCHGDTALGIGPVLPYGTFVTVAEFRCESRTSGLTCTNDGHGFSLSREKYDLDVQPG